MTASPPAKIHFSEVWPVTGLTCDERLVARLHLDAVADLLQVERLADGHQHVVGRDDEGVAAFFRPAAAGAVELAQPHGHALDARHALAFQHHFHRRGQQSKHHALVLGLFDFFFVGGHGLAAAAIDHGDVFGAQPQGGAGGVDGRIAAADHHHVLAHRHRAAEVVGAEEGEGVGDAFGVGAGHAQPHARRRAHAQKHGVVALRPATP